MSRRRATRAATQSASLKKVAQARVFVLAFPRDWIIFSSRTGRRMAARRQGSLFRASGTLGKKSVSAGEPARRTDSMAAATSAGTVAPGREESRGFGEGGLATVRGRFADGELTGCAGSAEGLASPARELRLGKGARMDRRVADATMRGGALVCNMSVSGSSGTSIPTPQCCRCVAPQLSRLELY